jgi:D-alanyl-D-alanine carboxypeptidase (penicillin-binding protein 5/6)
MKKPNLLFLTILSFVFIATSAVALSIKADDVKEETLSSQKVFSPLPVLSGSETFPIISGQAALAVDLDSGVTLYEKEPDKQLLPASTTKIVTALVAMEYYPPDAVLEVKDPGIDGQKMGLVGGEKIKASDLLYGLLVFSANDAAETLAQNFPGGRDLFVAAMNLKAKELHLEETHFQNPTGLDGMGHVTTARDLIRVATVAMENPEFAKIVGTREKVVKSENGKIVHRLTNINELLGVVDGVLGVKTGWTENARENLVTYLERDGKKIMIVLLGSQDRFGETRELIDWIFANYLWQEVKYPS